MTGARGFTLVELIVVIVVSGIVAVVVARNVARPLQGFEDATRRAALADAAGSALDRVTREVRLALPNSVRVAGGTALEFLRTRSGGRYRAQVDPGGTSCPGMACDPLEFSVADTSFDVLGTLRAFGQICAATSPSCGGGVASTATCLADTRIDCLVIYNTGQPADCSLLAAGRTNAYCGDNVAGIDVADAATGNIAFVIDTGRFPLPSPRQRFHVVDTPVSFVCDLASGVLLRYDGYAVTPTQPTVAAPPATPGRVLADGVSACSFAYDPGSATRAALVTATLTLRDPVAANETVTVFQQAHVPNVP